MTEAELAAIAAERARRAAGRPSGVFDARARMNPPQQSAHDDTSRFRALFWGRRTGKTTFEQWEGLEAVTSEPDSLGFYASTTLNRAVKTVWDELCRDALTVGGVPNVADHYIRFPNRSRFFVLGFETKKLVDRVRGFKRIVYGAVDEWQDYDSEFLMYAVGSVIMPALADRKGRLDASGTGGPPDGYWWEVVTGGAGLWSVHKATIWDNPAIKDPDEELENACKVRGVTRDDPYIRREWGSKEKGIEFTTDSERSVIPRITIHPREQMDDGWRRLIGADVGSVDKTACSEYAVHPHFRRIRHVRSEERQTAGASDAVAFIKAFADEAQTRSTHPVHVAVDPGGGGKLVEQDLKRFANLEAIPAEKINKASNLRLMADDIRTGFLVFEEGSETAVKGLHALEWEPGKEGEALRGHAPDAADGALYGYRLAKKFFDYVGAAPTFTPDPEIESAREMQEQEEDMMREVFG